MIRTVLLASIALALCACAKKSPPADDTLPDDLHPGSGSGGAIANQGGTELERRRDAACEALGPRMTACAIADARATMTAEELAKLDIEQVATIHTREFVKDCKSHAMSSRQVPPVHEICLKMPRMRPRFCGTSARAMHWARIASARVGIPKRSSQQDASRQKSFRRSEPCETQYLRLP